MDLLIFGIQGSGKGTQAKKLAAEYGYYIFEAGGELRKISASGSELGNRVKSYIDEGHLVPHEIIMQVVKEALLAQPQDKKILFDGIPRDQEQKKDFDFTMNELGREFHCVQILLNEEEAIQRVRGRAVKEGRADDADEEKIHRRMELFKTKTLPVIQAYKEQGKLIEVDGSGKPEEVYEQMSHSVELAKTN